jgi:DNA repair exonuclease SbcCD nuclease subunit
MAKIMFVGDIHLTGIAPASRKETNEQYRQVQLDKLDSIKNICKDNSISNVIILGDVFNNNSSISNYFETDIWSKFLEFKELGIDVYTIIGNHDMIFQNDEEFKGSYLYKSFLAGIIKHLDNIKIDGVYIKGFDYNKDFIQCEEYCRYSICVAHSFYENSLFGGFGNSNLTDEKCIDLSFNSYVLGHDHTQYSDLNTDKYTVIRPGSLLRGTSKTCNLYRNVTVSIFDTSNLSWSSVNIPIKKGEEVFKEKVFVEKSMDLNLDKLLESFSYSKDMGLYDVIDNRESIGRDLLKEDYDGVINIITTYCESVGIYRRGV